MARIVNNGPGMALALEYVWYLSMDSEIIPADMTVGGGLTGGYLYAGGSTIVNTPIFVPDAVKRCPQRR